MRMIKCLKGHMYNAEKFSQCPVCEELEAGRQLSATLEPQSEVDTEKPKTVKQQVYEIVGRRRVVGCLLCISGSMAGQAFFLLEGQNDIGRSANLEVALSSEVTVSRQAHACILYEGEKNRYVLMAAEGKRDVLYRKKMVAEPVELENGSVIQIGQCSLRFFSFCDAEFSWK